MRLLVLALLAASIALNLFLLSTYGLVDFMIRHSNDKSSSVAQYNCGYQKISEYEIRGRMSAYSIWKVMCEWSPSSSFSYRIDEFEYLYLADRPHSVDFERDMPNGQLVVRSIGHISAEWRYDYLAVSTKRSHLLETTGKNSDVKIVLSLTE